MLIIRAKLDDSKRIYRDIAVNEKTSLYKLAHYVINAFEFDFDHSFGFYSSPDVYGKAKDTTHYELFYDIGEEVEDMAESVEKTLVGELFKLKKDKWWMLFDYGDDWVFELECIATESPKYKNGEVIKINGDAPEQYPEYED